MRHLGLVVQEGYVRGSICLNDNTCRVDWNVIVQEMDACPLLGMDFFNHYSATLRLRGDCGALMVRQPIAPLPRVTTPYIVRPSVEVCVAGGQFKAEADTGSTKTFLNYYSACLTNMNMVRLSEPITVDLFRGYCLVELMVPILELYV